MYKYRDVEDQTALSKSNQLLQLYIMVTGPQLVTGWERGVNFQTLPGQVKHLIKQHWN